MNLSDCESTLPTFHLVLLDLYNLSKDNPLPLLYFMRAVALFLASSALA